MSEPSPKRLEPGRWLVPSLGSLLGLTTLANGLFFRSRHFFAWDGDVGRHIRVGRTILENGVIPTTDLFSHTKQGARFVPYEWFSETLMALVEIASGLPGVVVLSALLYCIAVFAIYRAAGELGSRRVIGFLAAGLALILQSVHLLPRPHLFTTALAAVFVLVLIRFAKSGNVWTLAPLPPLMIVWANSHGGFLVGFILLAFFLTGALVRSVEFASPRRAVIPLLLTIVACTGASLLNPAGISLWTHTTGYLGIDFLVDATQEYRSIDFHTGYGKLFFVGLLAGPMAWMTGRVRVSLLAAGLYLFFAAAALYSARNIPLFTVAVMPWLALWIHEVLEAAGPPVQKVLGRLDKFEDVDRMLQPGASVLAAVALVWMAVGPNRSAYRFDPQVFPVGAVSGLEPENTHGNVFNQLIWGGYLLYERPDIPVFIDGQTDFYGEALSREYIQVLKGHKGWREVLDRYGVRWTLVANGEPINQLLELDTAWSCDDSDPVATVCRRRARIDD